MSVIRSRGGSPVGTGLEMNGDNVNQQASHGIVRRAIDSIISLQRRGGCTATEATDTCEKPVGSSAMTLPIVLGIVIPVVVAICILIFLHRRNIRRERLEDAHDPNKGLDFGLEDAAGRKKGFRKSLGFGTEKTIHKQAQLSMDMNLTSPYLLPPGAQGSQESIHSLARTLAGEQDPYRHVAQYTASDAGSVRSFNPATGSPLASGKSRKPGHALDPLKMPPRNNSFPRSPTSAQTPMSSEERDNPFESPSDPKPTRPGPHGEAEIHDAHLPVQPIVPEIDTVQPIDKFNADEFEMPDLPPPASRHQSNGSRSPFEDPVESDESVSGHEGAGFAHANDAYPDQRQHAPHGGHENDGLGIDIDIPAILSPGALPHEVENGPLYDQHGNQPHIQTTQHFNEPNTGRGRAPQPRRGPSPPQGAPGQQRGLGVPQNPSKRLSVGFRPLPPNEVTESEDPEFRANRIRSFYKEYFDESKEAPPPMPSQQPKPSGAADYYEDYDEGYLGDLAAYYDAETNAFVMPYAQPVTRRAMTPPPAGRTPMPGVPKSGPRGPHGPHGSTGGMSLPGGRPRAGSAVGPRPGSSASGRWGRGPPKKNLPPPSPLNTLPTPSKLKDDSFAILNATDFAPPTTFSERAAGRSQSPLGERRPYQPKLPAVSPLVSSYDELAALPSPHMLRKSTTFTNLDFAPPKKFKDPETASDAGSIRSNKSGISAVQLNALRGGAGRVSRLPGDTVFTAAAMDDQLKPQWGMRP